jgi:hypothetical protein
MNGRLPIVARMLKEQIDEVLYNIKYLMYFR